jgi:hypothetical protein
MFHGSSSAMEFEVTTTNTLFYAQIQIQMLCDNTTTVFSAQRRPSSSLTCTVLHLTSHIFHSNSTLSSYNSLLLFFADSSFRFASQSPQSTKSPSTFGGSVPIHSFIIHLSLLLINY